MQERRFGCQAGVGSPSASAASSLLDLVWLVETWSRSGAFRRSCTPPAGHGAEFRGRGTPRAAECRGLRVGSAPEVPGSIRSKPGELAAAPLIPAPDRGAAGYPGRIRYLVGAGEQKEAASLRSLHPGSLAVDQRRHLRPRQARPRRSSGA